MNQQLFVDSLVAVNSVVSLVLWLQFSLWSLYPGQLPAEKRKSLLGLALFFPLLLTISLSHASWIADNRFLELLETALAVLIGPFLLDFVHGRYRDASWLPGAVATAVLAAPLLWLLNPLLPIFLPSLFTLAAAGVCLRERRVDYLAAHVLTVALIIHLSQFARFAWRDVAWFAEIVPFTATLLGLFYSTLLLLRRLNRRAGARTTHRPGAEADRKAAGGTPADEDCENLEGLFLAVDGHLQKSRLWRDPELSLASLSRETGVPAYILSQAINGCSGRFNDYVNNYRVQDFLAQYQPGANVEELAYKTGFNSRSAFYRAFRKATGTTPSLYAQCRCSDLQIGT
ncbi:MAG: helix-turn-helix domain-containing protein [Pseudohongiellaceae bacterium]